MNQHIQYELQEKDLIIMDHNKLNTMLQRRLFSVFVLFVLLSAFFHFKQKYVCLMIKTILVLEKLQY